MNVSRIGRRPIGSRQRPSTLWLPWCRLWGWPSPGPGRADRVSAMMVRSAYGIPHITGRGFGWLGSGYGFAVASDDLCTMAEGARRSRPICPACTG
jgi:hypothetical protein